MTASRARKTDTPSGILLLDKPSGLGSNAALGRAKRLLGIKKAGHTGTLDPMASGLLALCFGEATKVAGFLLDADKAYLAEATLGITTDSEDAEGEVLERRPVPELDEAAIEAVLDRFRGPIEQVPPMHSALKHQGKRLYELARKGETVERPPRAVVIHALKLIGWQSPVLKLDVRCSKGTYIRSLVRDIGEALGCGAHLSALRRTLSEPFSIDKAIGLADLDGLDVDQARSLLIPPDQALLHLPAVELEAALARRLQHGQTLAGIDGEAGLVRAYGEGEFLGIATLDESGHLRARRLFATA
ncbi:tRNA pseudouridine(55) synthase TruB [Wenzhouxiangella marina]|uniref:tRNA pseudouridine synthase B n=1 Tax=Wenzhouxiangella marina TaxID=1579979 RepID=A0A0K0XTP9_9GAMM|nr:tRNA pseudouridine(55) synthase TruB [Wenzhouxiangella marina]AKS40997.1 pseudouridine synthase [Wenzhouxiangella marina]MBB6087871.1 tRNA pseudouridine55 synthase [Wenzhouxiangella marina]